MTASSARATEATKRAAARRDAAGDGGTGAALSEAGAAPDDAWSDDGAGAEDGAELLCREAELADAGADEVRGADEGAGAAGGVGRSAAGTQGSERRDPSAQD